MPAADAPVAVGGAPEGDPYLLPTLMAELTLTEMGWCALNLGPDVPVGSLAKAVADHHPRLVWISMTSHAVKPRFIDGYPAFYEAARRAGAAVTVGGQGVSSELQDRLVAAAFGTRLAHLKAFAERLR